MPVVQSVSLLSNAPKVGENSSVTTYRYSCLYLSLLMRMSYVERERERGRDEGRDMLEMETGVVYTRDGEVFVERLMVDI